ncbi:hypothetical protein HY085_01000 [Candidatus Gottesmanbacteria bacterium]|nr:hypothetical protein [Candidatus Gottesmanbacteria bacterium]
MTFLELQGKIKTPLFTIVDAAKYFPKDSADLIRIQLHRFIKKGYLREIKRGLYQFSDREADEFFLANTIYEPSYVSLESALNYWGIIPDIPAGGVTSVSPVTTKEFSTTAGRFFYHKLDKKLFWGYSLIPFRMAFPEKALLDYTYLRGKKAVQGLRVDWSKVDRVKYKKFAKFYD